MNRFSLTIFLSAFLLFQVQLIIAKYILPWFGGSSAVWNACMLFFQILLTGGYVYAHLVGTRLSSRRQGGFHVVVLAAAALLLLIHVVGWPAPILPSSFWKPADGYAPVARILLVLAVSVGLPFFVLSTTSSLLQVWFSRRYPDRSPYPLYALSNAGSLLALLSYPFLVEPALPLRQQAWVWTAVFLIFAALCAWCAIGVPRQGPAPTLPEKPAARATAPEPPASWARRLLWMLLPGAASVLLLATTNAVTEEVAVFPFMWVIPLGIYLLTFIICFHSPRWYSRTLFTILWLVTMTWVLMSITRESWSLSEVGFAWHMLGYSLALFACCMLGHGEVARLKPAPQFLTSYYLTISIGGALGGVFVTLLAPVLFTCVWELYLGYFLIGFLLLVSTMMERRAALRDAWHWPLVAQSLAILLVLLIVPYLHFRDLRTGVVRMHRNFYGIFRVAEGHANDPKKRRYKLYHAGTMHGFQLLDPKLSRKPTCYYTEESGLALAIVNHPRRQSKDPAGRSLRIGLVGLGAGVVASRAEQGDYLRIYEINPAIVDLSTATNKVFTFLQDCPAKIEIALGDARVCMERELKEGGSQKFDVLVLDAFNGDSPPVHLLTKDAFELYQRHLNEGGIIAAHVSNRYLGLDAVVFRIAEALNLPAMGVISEGDAPYAWWSSWVLMTRNEAFHDSPALQKVKNRVPSGYQQLRVWTDDYSNLFEILKK